MLVGSDSDLIRRQMSADSMISVCSSGGSQQSAAGEVGTDKKKKPKVWVMSHRCVTFFRVVLGLGLRLRALLTTLLLIRVAAVG